MELIGKIVFLSLCVRAIQSMDSNETGVVLKDSNKTGVVLKDGASLTQMGRLYDNPLLRMLGQVFTHTEGLAAKAKEEIFEDLCDFHPCSTWSKWTDCTTRSIGSYGIQTRKRSCGVDSPFCIQPKAHGGDEATTEDDIRICEGGCKFNYTTTPHGFCLKLFKDRMSKSNADARCHSDGGFVINIDSEIKSDDLHEILADAYVTTQTIWIDGRRRSISSPWSFEYGTTPVWTNWYSSEPSDSGIQYCRVEESNPRTWWDRNCNGPYWFVCEV